MRSRSSPSADRAARTSSSSRSRSPPSGPQPSLRAGYPASTTASAMRRTSSGVSGITSLAYTRTRVVVRAVKHALPEACRVQRVLTHEKLAQAARDRVRGRHLDDRAGDVGRRIRLTDPDDALVRVHADEEGVLRAVGARRVDPVQPEDDRLDVGDPHRVTDPIVESMMPRISSAAASSVPSGVRWARAETLMAPEGCVRDSRKTGTAKQTTPGSLSSRSSA